MMRFRRYRVFVIGAAVVLFLLYRLSQNEQWQTKSPDNSLFRGYVPPSSHDNHPVTGGSVSNSGNRYNDGMVRPPPEKEKKPAKPVAQIEEIEDPDAVAAAKAAAKEAAALAESASLSQPHASLEAEDEQGSLGSPTSYLAPEKTVPADLQGAKKVVGDGSYAAAAGGESIAPTATAAPDYNGLPASTAASDSLYSTIHWSKIPEFFPVPDESLILLPTGTPKTIPRIQFPFNKPESDDDRVVREARQAKVRAEMQHAWGGYRTHAWGHDELAPVTKEFRDPFCGWAASIVDALDTLWIMGMQTEFNDAYEAVKKIDFTTTPYKNEIPVFETTIRYLGGLLSAYDISGGQHGNYPALLQKAVELAEILMGIFDTPNRMPVLYYSWKPAFASQRKQAGTDVNVAELGSLSLEFTRLAQLTGKDKYYDAVARITDAFEEWGNRGTAIPGLFPQFIDASGCNRTTAMLQKTTGASKAAQDQIAAAQDLGVEPVGYVPNHPPPETVQQGTKVEQIKAIPADAEFVAKDASVPSKPASAEFHVKKRSFDEEDKAFDTPKSAEKTTEQTTNSDDTINAAETPEKEVTEKVAENVSENVAEKETEELKRAAVPAGGTSNSAAKSDSVGSVSSYDGTSSGSSSNSGATTYGGSSSGSPSSGTGATSNSETSSGTGGSVSTGSGSGSVVPGSGSVPQGSDSLASGSSSGSGSVAPGSSIESGIKDDAAITGPPSGEAPLQADGQTVDFNCVPQGLTPGGYGMQSYSMGGAQDSTYEYFPKEYLLLGGLEDKYRVMHEKVIDAVDKYLLYRPMIKDETRDIRFSSKVSSRDGTNVDLMYSYEITHLTCFLGGMYAMGGRIFDRPEDIETGKKLTDGCVWAYETIPIGIMPEGAHMIACMDKTSCSWNETLWREQLDPSKDYRDNQQKDYKDNVAAWQAKKAEILEMQELRRQESAQPKAVGADGSAVSAVPGAPVVPATAPAAVVPTSTYDSQAGASYTAPASSYEKSAPAAAAEPVVPAVPAVPPAPAAIAKRAVGEEDRSAADESGTVAAEDEAAIEKKVKALESNLDLNGVSGKSQPDAEAAQTAGKATSGQTVSGGSPVPAGGSVPAGESVPAGSKAVPVGGSSPVGGSALAVDSVPAGGDSSGSAGKAAYAAPGDPLTPSSTTYTTSPTEEEQVPIIPSIPPEPLRPQSHDEYVQSRIEKEHLLPGFIDIPDRRYILRPEAIESVWYMYRITGDPIWQEKGWKMFEAIVKWTKTEAGHSAINDILTIPEHGEYDLADNMESFWFGETLKYFYLLYSKPDVLNLDEWVLNTEAHAFKRPT